jgi:hypothetical protein
MPSNDHHARYGQGHYWYPLAGNYYTNYAFYVCTENDAGSDGVRVCNFDSSDLDDFASIVRIYGNSLANTIVASGGSNYPDSRRYCNNYWYYVYGWSNVWSNLVVYLYGYGGNDYLSGAPYHPEYMWGGSGNDFLTGGSNGQENILDGGTGYDMMHYGTCHGNLPSIDDDCYDTFGEWEEWPYFSNIGDCCCASCWPYDGCSQVDGIPSPPCPVPWGE